MSRSVLVTGGARRIGAAIARQLAGGGWRVIVHYHGSDSAARGLAGEIGGETIQADLSDRAAMRRLVPKCIEFFGPLDALVNNASSFRYDSIAAMDGESLDFHLRPNLEAPLFLSQAFASAPGRRRGAIVNLLDHKVAALNPDFFSYTLAKVAMAGATRMLAMAFEGRIRVNGVAPGIALLSGKQTEAGFARAWTAPPLGRSCTPEEVADAVGFALECEQLNGEILVLDGGEGLLEHRRDVAFR